VRKKMSKKVALMCGHGKSKNGSWDPGTTYKGYSEAALMLPITKAAVKYLRKWGVKVISDADTNNNKNMIVDVAWANKQKCDIYVSVHCDYSKAPSGVMPLYVSKKGKKLASSLNSIIKSGMPMKSRGVVKRTDLWELNGTDMVACILETGSIKGDLPTLKKYPDKYGKLIAKGICSYLGITVK
jgi:N-acetylmuramoyl-L-alanine amidase